MQTRTTLLSGVLALALSAGTVLAQDQYPNRNIRIIVPTSPGAVTDILARSIGQAMSQSWGQPVIVDNRPGAASNIGAEAVARAAPDGYTMFLGSVSTSINPSLYTKLAYDPLRDFAAIALVANTPFLLVTHPSVPVKTVKDLIAFAKARPGQLNYATAGAGSGAHLFMELFNALTGVQSNPVPYRGAVAGGNDVMAGEIPMMFDNIDRKSTRLNSSHT